MDRTMRGHDRVIPRRRRGWRIATLLAVTLCASPGSGADRTTGESSATAESVADQILAGSTCIVVGVPYTAFKLAFAGLGAVAGGLVYAASGGSEEPAQTVWDASLGGTYIITPEHVRGKREVHFIGETFDERLAQG